MPTGVILVATNLRWSQAGLATRLGAGVALPGAMHMRVKCASAVDLPGNGKRTASGKRGDSVYFRLSPKSAAVVRGLLQVSW